MMKQLSIFLALMLATLLMAGCSTKQSSPAGGTTSAVGRGRATLNVQWKSVTKGRLIPGAANAIHLVVKDTNNVAWVDTVVARPASGATTSSTSFDNLPTGNLVATAKAYAGYDMSQLPPVPSGAILAQGQAALTVNANTTSTINLVMSSTVKEIVITPNSDPTNIKVGGAMQFVAEAKNAAGQMVLLAPGTLKWSITNDNGANGTQTSNVASVDTTGRVSGVIEGLALLTATDTESQVSKSVKIKVTNTPSITVVVNPSTVTIPVLGVWRFTATVSNGATNTVTWAVDGSADNGTVTNDGVYSAPKTAGIYHVTATSTEDASVKATSTIIVTAAMTLSPTSSFLASAGKITFTARILGSTDQSIYWAIQEGEDAANGAITPVDEYATSTYNKCTYTAPAVLAGYKVYHIVASSHSDRSIFAIATVTVGTALAAPAPIVTYGGLSNPRGIAVKSDGAFYVADSGNHTVVRYDNAGANLGSFPAGLGLNTPVGVTVDAAGKVYLADSWNARIVVTDAVGAQPATWSRPGTLPQGLAAVPSGGVYMVDSTGCKVIKTDAAGATILSWGLQGTASSQLMAPVGIAVDGAGNVYVADTQNHRIQKFNASGFLLAKWGGLGSGEGEFDQPNGVAVDATGNVYVADTNNDRIQKFNSSGAFLGAFGTTGAGLTNFNHPTALGIDGTGNLFVVDSGNNRVVKYNPF